MAYQVGIVGAGENARDHGRACRDVAEAELVAICDISEAALRRYQNEFGVPSVYTDLDGMLAEHQFDIVIVSTWGVYHAEVSNKVARSGKVRAIQVEKPISSTAAECEEMMAVAGEHGVVLAEGFKFRHHPQHDKVKEIVDSGAIGQVKSVVSTLSSPMMRFTPLSNWRFHRARGGGSVFDTASYLIHFARFIVGEEPQTACAVGRYVDSADVEISAEVLLDFPGGAAAHLTASYEYGYCQATSIVGTRGWIRMDLPFDQRSVREVEFVEKEDLPATVHVFHDNFDSEVYQFAPVGQFGRELEHLCASLNTGQPPTVPASYSLGNMRAIDAVFESMRTGRAVQVATG